MQHSIILDTHLNSLSVGEHEKSYVIITHYTFLQKIIECRHLCYQHFKLVIFKLAYYIQAINCPAILLNQNNSLFILDNTQL